MAVLSYGLWQRRFGGDRSIVGKSIALSGVPHTVIGIVARSFNTELDAPPDLWIPFQIDPASVDHGRYFNMTGRLQPGSPSTWQTRNSRSRPRSSTKNSLTSRARTISSWPSRCSDAMVADVRPSLLVLAGAVCLVLLIASANVANLLLVRATGRKREIAIRLAIGAGRGRIVRQLLTESLLLSVLGGALGLALGMAGIRGLFAMNPGNIPRIGPHGALVAHGLARADLHACLVALRHRIPVSASFLRCKPRAPI